jgi:hypothetical protein
MMWKLLLALMLVGCAPPLATQTAAQNDKPDFEPAKATTATELPVPVAGNGTVVLDVPISETGKIQKIEVRRDIDSLTGLAVKAVQDWSFAAATVDGKAIFSRVAVAVTFRPPGSAAPVPLPALIPQSEAAIQAEFQPVEITRAAFPRYPDTTVIAGTVVLQVVINEKGEPLEDMIVLRDLPPLTDEAKAVVGDFRFIPATLNGSPVRSKVVLAFVSQPVTASPP